jgi:anti-sigma factor RsiW
MNNDLYRKLVDLYGGGELPSELEEELEAAAFGDPSLNHDMTTLRRTVDMLKNTPAPEFTEESYQRILMKLYARGAAIQPQSPEPAHLQYHLPMQG